jgi:DNA-binding CsgD family transcriptional regulator
MSIDTAVKNHLWVVPAAFHAPLEPAAEPARPSLALLMLERVDCALVACDPLGRVQLANRAARRELASSRVLRLCDTQLRSVHEPQDEFLQLLRDAALRQRSRMLWLGSEPHRLMLAAMPLPAADPRVPVVLLMLGRRSLCSPLGLEMLAIEHGLTPAERRVMRALISNQAPRQIASDHGVAMCTVRTQIIAIRNKLGVRNIDALMLRAAQVPPVASAHDAGE